MKNSIKKIFTPLENVSTKVMWQISGLQVLILILFWVMVPEKNIFPSLGTVLKAWKEMWMNGLFYHITSTIKLCAVATFISIIFSSLVAYATRIPFFKPLGFLLSKLRYNPIQGFTLFIALTTGGGRTLQIFLLVVFMSFYFISALVSILDDIPDADLVRRTAQKMNKWKILWKVVIVDRLDYLIEVIRLNLSMTFMMIVSVEAMDKTQGGIGALLVDTNRGLNFPKVFALQLTILFIGIMLDFLLQFIFKSFPANQKIR